LFTGFKLNVRDIENEVEIFERYCSFFGFNTLCLSVQCKKETLDLPQRQRDTRIQCENPTLETPFYYPQ